MSKRIWEVNPRESKAASKFAYAPNVLSVLCIGGHVGCKILKPSITLQQCLWWLSKTIITTKSKNDTSQFLSQVPSVINGGNQSTNIGDISNRNNPPSTAATISKPTVKHLRRTATHCFFNNGILPMRINVNNLKKAKLIWMKLHLDGWRKSSSRKLPLQYSIWIFES